MPAAPRALLDPAAHPRTARGLLVGAWAVLSLTSVAGALLRSPDALRATISIAALDGQHVYVVQNEGRSAWPGGRVVFDEHWLAEMPPVEAGTAWRVIGADLVDLRAAPLALVDPFYQGVAGTGPDATRRSPPLDAPPRHARLTVAGRFVEIEVAPPMPQGSPAAAP